MKTYRPAPKRIDLSVGDSLRILRRLQGLSQSRLAELTGIARASISAVETGRVNLTVERAKALARALKCHPAALVFPGWGAPPALADQAQIRRYRGKLAWTDDLDRMRRD